MKKLLVILIGLGLFVPQASALQIFSDVMHDFEQRKLEPFPTLTIEVDNDAEITAENGINLILDTEEEILWDAFAEITLSGSAVDNDKVIVDQIDGMILKVKKIN